MPTGYTSEIYEGKNVSGNEFLMKCARAFGATILMRDDTLDKEIPVFEPNLYHLKSLEQAKLSLEKYKNMTQEEATIILTEQYEGDIVNYNKNKQEKTALKERYEIVLKEVELWNPPSEDHIKLKEYAVEQLTQSIDWDCNIREEPVMQDANEWLRNMISRCEWDIEYYTKQHKEEVERTEERNKWIKQLRDSLQ